MVEMIGIILILSVSVVSALAWRAASLQNERLRDEIAYWKARHFDVLDRRYPTKTTARAGR